MRLLISAIAVLAIAATGCIESLTPEEATNVVGTSHTVTASIGTEFIDEFCEAFEEEIGETCDVLPDQSEIESEIYFGVLEGPNAGTFSDGDCDPSCIIQGTEAEVSWTYESNGETGTDLIMACIGEPGGFEDIEELLADIELIESQTPEIAEFLAALSDATGREFDSLSDVFCLSATKTWIALPAVQDRPNVGGAIAGVLESGSQAAATAQAGAQQPAAGPAGITPPNTGDAGLR
jgi:hypothetical protein